MRSLVGMALAGAAMATAGGFSNFADAVIKTRQDNSHSHSKHTYKGGMKAKAVHCSKRLRKKHGRAA